MPSPSLNEQFFSRLKSLPYQSLTYLQLHHQLSNRKLNYPLIHHCLTFMYKGMPNPTQINPQKIVSDAMFIHNYAVNQQWKLQQLTPAGISHKLKIYSQYRQKVQTKQQIIERIKLLKRELICLEKGFDAKGEQERIQAQEKYRVIREEYDFWRNKSRRIKTLSSIKESVGAQPNPQRMNTINNLVNSTNGNTVNSNPIRLMQCIPKQKQLLLLRSIFKRYTVRSIYQSFQSRKDSEQLLSNQGFCQFIRQFNLNRLLKIERINAIFKKNTSGVKYATFQQWTQIIRDICQAQCSAQNIPFTIMLYDTFLQQQIIRRNKAILSAKIQKPKTRYVYKVLPHTGKSVEDIFMQLKQRKMQRKIKSIRATNSVNARNAEVIDVGRIGKSDSMRIQTPSKVSSTVTFTNVKTDSYTRTHARRRQKFEKLQKISFKPTAQNTSGGCQVFPTAVQESNVKEFNTLQHIIQSQSEDEYLNQLIRNPTMKRNKRINMNYHF